MSVQVSTYAVNTDTAGNPQPLELAPPQSFGVIVQCVITNNTPFTAILTGTDNDRGSTRSLPPGTSNKFIFQNYSGPISVAWQTAIANPALKVGSNLTVDWSDNIHDLPGVYPTAVGASANVSQVIQTLETPLLTTPITITNIPANAASLTFIQNGLVSPILFTVTGVTSGKQYVSALGVNVLTSTGGNTTITVPIMTGIDSEVTFEVTQGLSGQGTYEVYVYANPIYIPDRAPATKAGILRVDARGASSFTYIEVGSWGPMIVESFSWTTIPASASQGAIEMSLAFGQMGELFQIGLSGNYMDTGFIRFDGYTTGIASNNSSNGISLSVGTGYLVDGVLTYRKLG